MELRKSAGLSQYELAEMLAVPQSNVAFWEQIADYAQQLNVTVAVENMWEFDPDIIGD